VRIESEDGLEDVDYAIEIAVPVAATVEPVLLPRVWVCALAKPPTQTKMTSF
jgi:hypothetical protein